jgi:hypothetical protein
MDANSGAPWSEMDISDLTHSLDYGDTFGSGPKYAVGQQSSAPPTSRRLRISWRKELADTRLQSSLMCRWGLFTTSQQSGWQPHPRR